MVLSVGDISERVQRLGPTAQYLIYGLNRKAQKPISKGWRRPDRTRVRKGIG